MKIPYGTEILIHRDMSNGSKLKKENLGQQAYKRFKDLIFARVWNPGEFVSQSELVEKTGVQISPMRDALHRLTAEGLVIITPRKGIQVIPASIKIIREVYHFRLILEKEALLFFIENAHDDLVKAMRDEHIELFRRTQNEESPKKLLEVLRKKGLDLHNRLIEFMGNDLVTKMHSINEDRIMLFRLDDQFIYTNKHVNETFKREHDDVINAISKRDASKAIEKLEYHNTMALKRAMGPPYF